jgi:bacterioferritin
MGKTAQPDYSEVITLLNRSLNLEYSIIIHLPRISNAFKDPVIRDKVMHLSAASVKHADTVAASIEKLGGKAEWNFESFPDDGDLVKMFEDQEAREELAHQMHSEVVRLLPEGLKPKFREIAKEEEWHVKVAQEILDYLKRQQAAG